MHDPETLLPFDLLSQLPGQNILQDDGEHVLVSMMGLPPSAHDGAMLRRCAFSVATPFGYESLGHYRHQRDGSWHAYRSKRTEVGRNTTTSTSVGIFRTELDALVNLWSSRRNPGFGRLV